MNDKEFIDAILNLSKRKLCKKLGISHTNISSGKANKEKLHLLRVQLEYEIEAILFQDKIMKAEKEWKKNEIL